MQTSRNVEYASTVLSVKDYTKIAARREFSNTKISTISIATELHLIVELGSIRVTEENSNERHYGNSC